MALFAPDFSQLMLESQTLLAFAILSWLIFKHFFCDFVLQTLYQADNKGRYGHPGGLVHVGIHGLGSAPLIAFAPIDAALIVGVIAVEIVVHYHIDWMKQVVSRLNKWTPADHAFWIALGFDQLLHYSTYVAMTLALLWLSVN